MKRYFIVIVSLILIKCSMIDVQRGQLPYESSRVVFNFLDRPNLQRIDIIYRNDSASTLYLPEGSWPFEDGLETLNEDYVALNVAGRRFVAQGLGGHCRNPCAVRVQPGQSVRGFISYRNFSLPVELYRSEKRVEFLDGPWAYRMR
jgi:hypothetical protein